MDPAVANLAFNHRQFLPARQEKRSIVLQRSCADGRALILPLKVTVGIGHLRHALRADIVVGVGETETVPSFTGK